MSAGYYYNRIHTGKIAAIDFVQTNNEYLQKLEEERKKMTNNNSPLFQASSIALTSAKSPLTHQESFGNITSQCLTGDACLFDKVYTNRVLPFGSKKLSVTNTLGFTDNETVLLEKSISNYNNKLRRENLVKINYNISTFRLYNRETHPLMDQMIQFMKSELDIIFPEKTMKISGVPYLVSETINKVKNGNTIVQFKMYISDTSKFMSRRIVVQLIVRGNSVIQVNNIKLDDSNNSDNYNFNIKPNDSNEPEYLETRNTMYLLGPFKTNSYISQVTEQDHTVFNQNLQKQKVSIEPSSGLGYACFGSIQALDAKNKFDCLNVGGVYDTPVREDQECPFFMSNTNYPNTFGGKNGYSCNVPLGVSLVGYRNPSADPKSAPLCYNCKTNLVGQGTLGKCCDLQLDRQEYPNLDTPDYAFAGDSITRNTYKSLFDYRGLSTE
jgi:hypothetical protein